VNRIDPNGRDSITIDFFSNAFFNFGFLVGAGMATWEDYYNWQSEILTPVSSNYSFDPASLTMSISIGVFAPFYPEPVFDAATGLLVDPTGYEEPGIQDASFGFWTTVVPVGRAVVGIGVAVGRGIVSGTSSAVVSSIEGRSVAAGLVDNSTKGLPTEINLTNTVAGNLSTRPYLNSPLTIQEIMAKGVQYPIRADSPEDCDGMSRGSSMAQ
jgi:hypothetical protein